MDGFTETCAQLPSATTFNVFRRFDMKIFQISADGEVTFSTEVSPKN